MQTLLKVNINYIPWWIKIVIVASAFCGNTEWREWISFQYTVLAVTFSSLAWRFSGANDLCPHSCDFPLAVISTFSVCTPWTSAATHFTGTTRWTEGNTNCWLYLKWHSEKLRVSMSVLSRTIKQTIALLRNYLICCGHVLVILSCKPLCRAEYYAVTTGLQHVRGEVSVLCCMGLVFTPWGPWRCSGAISVSSSLQFCPWSQRTTAHEV